MPPIGPGSYGNVDMRSFYLLPNRIGDGALAAISVIQYLSELGLEFSALGFTPSDFTRRFASILMLANLFNVSVDGLLRWCGPDSSI